MLPVKRVFPIKTPPCCGPHEGLYDTPTLCQSPHSSLLGIHLHPHNLMGAYSSGARSLPPVVSNLSPVQSDHTSRGGLRGPSVPSSALASPHHPASVQAASWAHVLDMKMQCTDHSPHPLPLTQAEDLYHKGPADREANRILHYRHCRSDI